MLNFLRNALSERLSLCRRTLPGLLFFLGACLPALAADPIRLEAETGVLTGVTIATTTAGYSGTGYVTGLDADTDQIALAFTAQAGLYELTIGYASPSGSKGIDFQLNGERNSATLPQTASGFRVVSLGKFLLKEGPNSLTIFRGWGYFDVDYLLFTPTTAMRPTPPPKTLVDAQATTATRGLFSYLVDQYGRKVISAQQDEVEYVFDKTGKEPAIGSFDLIDYSPTRVQYGAKPTRTTEAIIEWAKKGNGRGIISLMWHWNAPADLVNQAPNKLWWRGFYTEATTFDLAAALADKNGSRYKLLLSDIDAIAVQLQKLQAADVPVLWRPLHEAPGGWFWWGAKGAGPFNELWTLLYNRLTNVHNLHNLIWVYTATDTVNADWYPGDAHVDVVGLDVYADASANLSGNWNSAITPFNGKKLVTLSETGNLPKPDNVRAFGTWWSWFSVWTGADYIQKQPADQLKAVFTDPDVITRDALPDWRMGTPLVTATEPTFQVVLLGNPVQGDQIDLVIRGGQNLPFSLSLSDLWGHLLTEQAVVPSSALHRYQLPLGRQAGLYFLRVSSPSGTRTFRIVAY